MGFGVEKVLDTESITFFELGQVLEGLTRVSGVLTRCGSGKRELSAGGGGGGFPHKPVLCINPDFWKDCRVHAI